MLADEFPAMGNKSPKTLGASPVGLMMYVEDLTNEEMGQRAAAAKPQIKKIKLLLHRH